MEFEVTISKWNCKIFFESKYVLKLCIYLHVEVEIKKK